MKEEKILIGISSCLLGEKVRFDGGHKKNDYIIKTLGEFFQFHGFCPEVEIGLGVPRPPIHLVEESGSIRCIGSTNPALDVTDQLQSSARAQHQWHQNLCGYILKKNSPSCGMQRVKLFKNGTPIGEAVGIYAQELAKTFPILPLEEEGRLGDPLLRENFVQRVFIYSRWRQQVDSELTAAKLARFHARHKLILMSHDQSKSDELERWLLEKSDADIRAVANSYLESAMRILKKGATIANHIRVLKHIQSYAKTDLDSDAKVELNESIEAYRQGLLPLNVPITLLKHHFRKHPNQLILDSYYMTPYPAEVNLGNLNPGG